MAEKCASVSCSTVELHARGEREAKGEGGERREIVGVSMRTETVSAAALGSTGFRYLYSVCFIRLFGPSGL